MADAVIGLWGFSVSGDSCGSSSASGSPPLDDDPPFELSLPKQTQPIKKIRNVRKSPIHKCAVCGDRPTGYHYDVLSCNGCKTFFRRTVINQRRFVCSRGGNCEFTKDFRCACRACRFSKCVSAGMNPKAIQFPAHTTIPKEEQDSPDEHEHEQQIQQQQMSLVPMLKQVKTEDFDHMMALDMILHREAAVRNLRDCDFPSFIYPDIPLDELLSYNCVLGKNKDGSGSPTQITSMEMYKHNPVRFWMIVDLFLTVEFAKTFTEFQTLSQRDRSEIMHKIGGAVQIFQQSYYAAMQHSDSITFPDGVNALYYQMVTMNRRQYEHYYRECYCKPVDIIRRLELSPPEFVMFKTIAIFSNELDISEDAQRVVKDQREKLITIFRKYLIGQYGLQRGTEKMASCLITISTFIDIAEKRRSYLHCIDLLNRCHVSKLAKGIYLKQSS